MHLENEESQLKAFGLWESIVSYLRWYADRYKNLIFSVENVTRLIAEPFSNAALVKDIDRENVGTCLDTCHAIITQFRTAMIECENIPAVTLDAFYSHNRKYMNWIHLNNATDAPEGFGYGSGHGVAFDISEDGDSRTLERIMYMFSEYCQHITHSYTLPICIEVQEDDYLFPPKNYILTKNSLEQKNMIERIVNHGMPMHM